jgi:hypothetical protein
VDKESRLITGTTDSNARFFLKKQDEIDEVFNLLTLQLGKDVMVAVKAKMAKTDSAEALVEAVNRCEVALKKAFPQVLWLFFEPDLKD